MQSIVQVYKPASGLNDCNCSVWWAAAVTFWSLLFWICLFKLYNLQRVFL